MAAQQTPCYPEAELLGSQRTILPAPAPVYVSTTIRYTQGIEAQDADRKPWPEAYIRLASPLLVAAATAGAMSTSLVLAHRDDCRTDVKDAVSTLATASSLFLSAAIGSISVFVLGWVGQRGRGGWWSEVAARMVLTNVLFCMICAFGWMYVCIGFLGFWSEILGSMVPLVTAIVTPLVVLGLYLFS